ncbi:MAG: tripartite tricarboxylate transporter permease [Rhodoferax sp.]|nr:tripartite tricarboxylate transporter permease [Rhodoferax sp.]MCW5644461.1 tripartite tricarboxylate transporter permease [Rhodoferax sp.]
MDVFTHLFPALSEVLVNPFGLALILFGVVVGFIFGATPGLTATMGVALFIPLTFPLEADLAIGMMIALYCGSMAGGAIPAILLNIPGTPSAVVTTLDGHPMARQGHAAKAYGWALIASIVGGLVSWVCLVTLAPALAQLALKLGPAEYAATAFLAMTIIASIVPGQLLKGALAVVIGLALSVVGLDQITGEGRWTFDTLALMRGIDMMPALIGLLVIPELLSSMFERHGGTRLPYDLRNFLPTLREWSRQGVNNIRSALIGVGVGIVPALGGSVGSLIAYDQAKRMDKDKAQYGNGAPGGIVASEAANNGVTGGALIPLLTLGIPGDTVTAMLLGGLTIHGLQPGPRLFETSGPIVWHILAAVLVANVLIIAVGLLGFRFFVRVLDVPRHLLIPALFVLAVVGTYALSNQVFDVIVMLALGVVGFLMLLASIPVYPAVIGVILGPLLESEMRRALVISGGDWSTFVTRPGAATILAIAVVALVLPNLLARWKRNRRRPTESHPRSVTP